jgi:hypothetical protein
VIDLRARDEQLARLLVGDQVELAVAVARLDVLEAVELLGRRAQRLGQQRPVVDAQRQLAAAVLNAVPSTPIRSPRSSVEQRSKRLLAEHVARACSWMRPERSTRSRNAILPWPRRAARRPATR